MPTLSEFINSENMRQQQESEQLANNVLNYMNVLYQTKANQEVKQAEATRKQQETLAQRQWEANKLEYTQKQMNQRQLQQQEFNAKLANQKFEQQKALEGIKQQGDVVIQGMKNKAKETETKPVEANIVSSYNNALRSFNEFKANNLINGRIAFEGKPYIKKNDEWYKLTDTGKYGSKVKDETAIKALNKKETEWNAIKKANKDTAERYKLELSNKGKQAPVMQSKQEEIKTADFYKSYGE